MEKNDLAKEKKTEMNLPDRCLNVKNIAKIGILAAIGAVLMVLDMPLFFAPGFYKLDFSEVVVLIGAFSMGPVAGIMIEAVKILINFALDGSTTMGVGEVVNFLVGCSFIVPAAVIYRRGKTKKHAVIGMSVGLVSLVIFSALMNFYVLIPVYAKVLGIPIDAIVGMGTKVNPAITDLKQLILFATVPFNMVKGGLSVLITLLIYKKVSGLLHG